MLKTSLKQIKEPSKSFLELAKLNAAVILFVTGKAATIEEVFKT